MRHYPPFKPCDEDLCLAMAEQDIVQEDMSGIAVVVRRACGWHVQEQWKLAVADYLGRRDKPVVRGFYVQAHVPR